MPRGQPDYGLTTQTPVASGISDPGEAAARLGSINVFDRRGWTVWMDDFEAPGLKWATLGAVGGIAPIHSSTYAWMGSQSLYFATGVAPLSLSQAHVFLPLIRQGKIGVELWIRLVTLTPNYFSLRLRIYDGTNISTADILLDSQAMTATILTAAGAIIVATNAFNTVGAEVFLPVKLVVDMDTDLYTRLLIGPQEIPLSAHALVAGGPTTDKYVSATLMLMGGAAGVGNAYVENFIFTQNEP